jgi:CRAL/TRIO domain
MARIVNELRQKMFYNRTLSTCSKSTDTADEGSSIDDSSEQRCIETERQWAQSRHQRRESFTEAGGQGNVKVSQLLSGSVAPHGQLLLISSRDEEGTGVDVDGICSHQGSFSSSESVMSLEFTEPDCYGGRHPIETDQLIANKLFHFENQLVAVPHHKKIALLQAQQQCPHLLTDQFKLKFLRCECFNEKLAAKRYVKYWENRVHIFGPIKAFQRLCLDEALRDDTVALNMGLATLTLTKDESGRNIIYADPTKQDIGAYTTESMARVIWYVLHAALEDETTQKKGVIIVVDLRIVKLSLFDRELVRILAGSVQGCIPVRLSGLHGTSPPRIFGVIFPFIKALLGERIGKRIRIHSSHNLEHVQEGLAKYGMPLEVIPTQLGGGAKICHQSWLKQLRIDGN